MSSDRRYCRFWNLNFEVRALENRTFLSCYINGSCFANIYFAALQRNLINYFILFTWVNNILRSKSECDIDVSVVSDWKQKNLSFLVIKLLKRGKRIRLNFYGTSKKPSYNVSLFDYVDLCLSARFCMCSFLCFGSIAPEQKFTVNKLHFLNKTNKEKKNMTEAYNLFRDWRPLNDRFPRKTCMAL